MKESGHKFEVLFISSDGSEEEANEYYADMPWAMLSFNDQDTKDALDAKFQIEGIPTLILLDEDANLITMEGTEAMMTCDFAKIKNFEIEKKLAAEKKENQIKALKSNFSWKTAFEEGSLIDKELKPVSLSSLDDKIVGLYFSAHWCPPCRGFTPQLAKKYTELINDGKKFEIVFISSDRDENSALEYFSEMPWKMLSYSHRETKSTLGELFEIRGIPSLILFDENAEVITTEGRQDLFEVPFDKIKEKKIGETVFNTATK